ncbi:hypothetical protein A2164_03790 [Candidatus Curtissbacteria bacterium RBG_13_35_7]|uniref:SAM-dependent methyltransferase n=1 Tax=Candidatus Curtissbacteria bacterium RBG_13_35_7 TaxID=1797705 RepID=A0A1F5G353_9BACT|nr:MAG: hypothetical protein A2164_03790 [Candidatus Curtissbacteria bacterium RBG_13_35_7]
MKKQRVKKAIYCRICKNKKLNKILSLGLSPLANSFLRPNELKSHEDFFPLELNICRHCGLVQLADIVNPKLMFDTYLYVSSTSQTFIDHFERFAQDTSKRFNLSRNDLIIDIGSNDGILLKPFDKLGIRTLGIDPAKNVARIARKNGIETITKYFDRDIANRIIAKYGKARLITGINVFAHINNWGELIQGVKVLLTDDGIFIIEVPYLLEFIKKNLFDTVYHEHLSYIAVKPLIKFFKQNGLEIFDVHKVETHGGSIRIFIKRENAKYKIQKSVFDSLKEEKEAGLTLLRTYKEFSINVLNNKKRLMKLLNALKKDSKRIIGYGAPAKGNTLLNFFGINHDLIDYIVDDSPLKQGLYTPGSHIPITSPNKIKRTKVDYILILAWNFADSIIKNHDYLKRKGIKFIIPVPIPKIVN